MELKRLLCTIYQFSGAFLLPKTILLKASLICPSKILFANLFKTHYTKKIQNIPDLRKKAIKFSEIV